MPSLLLYLTINPQKRQTYSTLSYFLKIFKKKKKNIKNVWQGPNQASKISEQDLIVFILLFSFLTLNKMFKLFCWLYRWILTVFFQVQLHYCKIKSLKYVSKLTWFFDVNSNILLTYFGFSVSAKISNIYWILVNFSSIVWVVNVS